MKVFNLTSGKCISRAVKKADTIYLRLFGLIPRANLEPEEGLWLIPCSAIHMCFMRFAIDAVFLDKELKVIRILENFKPWRFSPFVFKAESVLELPSGRACGQIAIGDRLSFKA